MDHLPPNPLEAQLTHPSPPHASPPPCAADYVGEDYEVFSSWLGTTQ